MRKLKGKINQLLLFYVLGISILGLSWRYGLIELTESNAIELKETFSFEKNSKIEYGEKGEIVSVVPLNPSLIIHYSLDGGKTFTATNHPLNFNQLEHSDIRNVPSSLRWRVPLITSEKLISAQLFLENTSTNTRSEIKTLTSLNGYQNELTVVHLNINQNDLFSENKGILVFGSESWNQSSFQEAWWFRDANFTQRGVKWEKTVQLDVFEDNQLKHQQKCGLRISGNATRGFPQKSFRIMARQQFGDDKFRFKMFGDEGLKKYESLVLRTSGNDNTRTLFADSFMQQLAMGSNVLTQKSKPSVLFINGNYWGIYNIRERIDEYFIAKYENDKKKNVTILEDGVAELKQGSPEVQTDFLNLIDEVKESNEIEDNFYKNIKAQIDIESFMDYIFFETYYANNDWPDNNAICYKVGVGKWKWMLNDLDYSLAYPGAENFEINIFDKLKSSASVHAVLFTKLITNSTFKADFKKACAYNIRTYLNENRVKGMYKGIKQQYDSEIENHIARWRSIASKEQWEMYCQENLNFILDRKEIYLKQLETL